MGTHVDLLFYTAFYNIALFGPLAATEFGEVLTFFDRPGEVARFTYFVIPYVVLGGLLNLTMFWCTAANSPLATAVAGSLKGVFSTVVGVAFFGARLTVVGWLGFALSALGGWTYSEAQKRKKKLEKEVKVEKSSSTEKPLAAGSKDADKKEADAAELKR